MKNLTTKMMIAAATLVAAAGVASAQTMRANVPFAFRANGQVFAAGSYRIHVETTPAGTPLILIRDNDSGKQVLTTSYRNGEAKAAWKDAGNAVLSFKCGVSRCTLTEIWAGSDNPLLRVPTPGLGKDEPSRVAQVVMHPIKGE